MGQYDLPDSASLKRRLRAGEFSSEPARPEIPPEDRSFTARPQTQDNADFSFGDVAGDLLAAPFRGAEGAVRSAYGLLDAITFDSLPDYTENFTGHSKYIAGGILEGLTQFGVGFYALGGAVGAIGKGVEGAGFLVKEAATAAEFIGPGKMALSTAGNIARGVLTDFTVFDGQSGRLADLAAKVPGLEEPMNEYLSFALTNKDDSELEGRMKNALEGAGVGAAIDGIMHGVRWLRKIKEEQIKGVPVDEAVKAANKTVHIKDINTIFKQLDDMRFAEESPFKGPLLDDAVAKANAGEDVWLNADATPDPAHMGFEHGGVVKIDVPAGSVPADTRTYSQRHGGADVAGMIELPPKVNAPDMRFAAEASTIGNRGLISSDPTVRANVLFPNEAPPTKLETQDYIPPSQNFADVQPSSKPIADGPLVVKPDLFPSTHETPPPIAGTTPQPGQLLALSTPEVKILLKQNYAHEAAVATDVLGRELKFDEKAVTQFVDLLRKARQGTNIERASAQKQIDAVLDRLSSRGKKKMLAVAPSGHATEDLMAALRVKIDESSLASPRVGKEGFRLGQRQKRGDIEGNIAAGRGVLSRGGFIPLSVKDFGTVMDRPSLANWVNQHGTLLDNPQTTIHLKDGRVEIGVTLRPEQAADDATKNALEALRCLEGI